MFLFGILGILAFVLAILHFVNPEAVLKLNKFGISTTVKMNDMVKKYPKTLGVIYLIASAVLIYVGFFLKNATW